MHCEVCSDYKTPKEMSRYKITDVFDVPTCNECVANSLGEDYKGLLTLPEKSVNMSLAKFNDEEKQAYYRLFRKIYVRSNPEKYHRRIKKQENVYRPFRSQIGKVYKWCKNLNKKKRGDYEVDHIVPIRGENVSGLHLPNNLEILPKDENRNKSNKFENYYYIHHTFGERQMTFEFGELDNHTRNEVIKFIEQYNEIYTKKFEDIMVTLFYKFINDTLCVEDFEEICSRHGIDIMESYSKLVDMMDENELNEYLKGDE